MKNIKTTRIDYISLINDYNQNIPPANICENYGISIPTMIKILRRYGVYREKKIITDDEIIKTYYKTQNIHKTSKILKCRTKKISEVLKRHNILPHKSYQRVKIGDRFNRFTVIGLSTPRHTKSGASVKMLICKCDCGSIRKYSSGSLRSGKRKSCGCIMKEKILKRQTELSNKKIITPEEKFKLVEERKERKQIKLDEQQKKRRKLEEKYELTRCNIGDKINRWTILSNETHPESKSIRNCDIIKIQCECGTIKTRKTLGIKNSISCGCYQKEKSTKNGLYGGENIKEKRLMYVRYKNMKKRCYDIHNHNYPNYGLRGIIICNRWMEPNGQGFMNFCQDMGSRPGPEYSIDRINNDGDYEPSNCQWATAKQQYHNRRTGLKKKRILLHQSIKQGNPF